MKTVHSYTIIPFIFFLLIASCKPSEVVPDPAILGYDYAPLDSGRFFIYNVVSVKYDPVNTVYDTFELKEEIAEAYQFGDEIRHVVKRFKREDSLSPWPSQPDSVWSISRDAYQLVKVENNIRFIKLIFPLEEGKRWNGNALNSSDEDDYQMERPGQPYSIDSDVYAETVKVVQNDNENKIDKDYRIEVYAKNIGLIYIEKEVVDYDQTMIGAQVIVNGIKYIQKLKSYGVAH